MRKTYISKAENVQAAASTTKNGYAVYQITMDGSRTDLSFERERDSEREE